MEVLKAPFCSFNNSPHPLFYSRDPKKCSSWLVSELFGRLRSEASSVAFSVVSAHQLASIVDLISADVISSVHFPC